MNAAENRGWGGPRPRGSALIVVLWVLSLLSLLIGSFAFDAHLEAKVTSFYRKRTRAESLARSGIEVAQMLLAKRATIRDTDEPPLDKEDRWFDAAKELKLGPVRGLVEPLGDGTITLDIVPEPARRDINNLDVQGNKNPLDVERNLELILGAGGITEESGMWPQLIESFLDWIDVDNAVRPDGAETDDHYATLEPPYRAKNGPLDTVGELLLVKGFTSAVLYGGSVEPPLGGQPIAVKGIADLLTAISSDGKVDVNSASMDVLKTIPGVDEVMAGAIIEEREGLTENRNAPERQFFKDMTDLNGRLPELTASTTKYFSFQPTMFRITSVGEVGGVTRRVMCIAKYDGSLSILQWREED